MKLHRNLLLVVVCGCQSVSPAMAVITHGGEIARLLATTDRISKMMHLCGRLAMTERASASCEADHFEAKVIPPLHFLVGGFETHQDSPFVAGVSRLQERVQR